jgi:hypothetical protein
MMAWSAALMWVGGVLHSVFCSTTERALARSNGKADASASPKLICISGRNY